MEPGVYDIPEEDYHRDPCPAPSLSRSTIKEILFDCPYRVWLNHPRLNPEWQPEEDAGKFDIGTSAHQIFLEGIDKVQVIEFDDWRKKEAKEQREQARANGLIPLLSKQHDEVLSMVRAAEKQLQESELCIEDLRKHGKTERSVFWREKETWLRIRPDWIANTNQVIFDYKTTGNTANPASIDRHIFSMGYDIQAALYSRGVEAITGKKQNFFFIFQETTKPYLCSFVGLNTDFMKMGKQKVEYGIFLWEKCLKENNWPAYPKEIAYVDAPGWALAQWEQIAANIC